MRYLSSESPDRQHCNTFCAGNAMSVGDSVVVSGPTECQRLGRLNPTVVRKEPALGSLACLNRTVIISCVTVLVFGGIMLLELTLLIFAAGCGILYMVSAYRISYWHRKGVPFLRPRPITGNVGKVACGRQQLHELLAEAYDAFPDARAVGLWTLDKPALVIRDPELAKHVLVKDFHCLPNRGFRVDPDCEPQPARAMFALRGAAWRAVRTGLSPVFSSGRMRLMHPLVEECGQELERALTEKTGDSVVVISDLSSRLFVDIITSCAFGGVGQALADPAGSVVYKILNGIFSLNWKQGLGAFVMYFGPWPLYRLLSWAGFGFYDRTKLELTARLVAAELQLRERGKEREDAFGLAVQLRDQQRRAGVPPHQSVFEGHYFTAIAMQFLVAGSETSSSTMTLTLYELALQPELQTRVRDYIRKVLAKHGGQLSYDAIHDMPFLDMVLNETMRLYPVLPFLDRICAVADYVLPGTDILIEKDTMVFIPIFSYQRDEKYFPDPLRYDPDRWQPENAGRVCKDAFMPFGAGPRFCIGNRFGMDGMKTGLCHILLRHEVRPAPGKGSEGIAFNRKSLNLSLQRPLHLELRPLELEQLE